MQFICQIGDSWMQITFFFIQIGYFRMHIVNVHFFVYCSYFMYTNVYVL